MKIAVCYSGFLRNIITTLSGLRSKILQDHDCDFFLHTWKHETQYKDELDYFLSEAKPKSWVVDTPRPFEEHPYYFGNVSSINWDQLTSERFNKEEKVHAGKFSTFPHNVLSQFYSKNIVNQLRKSYSSMSGQEYDLVISLRSDIQFNETLNYDEVDPNKINTSWLNTIGADYWNHPLMLCDMIAMGSEEVMNCYFDCNLYFPTNYFVHRVDFIPEILLGYHLQHNGIEVNKLNLSHTIFRVGKQLFTE